MEYGKVIAVRKDVVICEILLKELLGIYRTEKFKTLTSVSDIKEFSYIGKNKISIGQAVQIDDISKTPYLLYDEEEPIPYELYARVLQPYSRENTPRPPITGIEISLKFDEDVLKEILLRS